MDYVISGGELYHHGIKGMKWGVRRYQNKDGSLTPAGRKRLAEGLKSGLDKDLRKAKTADEAKAAVKKYRQNVSDAVNKVITNEDKKVVLDARRKAVNALQKLEDSEFAAIDLEELSDDYAFQYYNKRLKEAPEQYTTEEAHNKLMQFAYMYGAGKAKRDHPDLVKAMNDYDENQKAYEKYSDEYVKACRNVSDKLIGEYGDTKVSDLESVSSTMRDSIMLTVAEMEFDFSEKKGRKR